MKKTLLFAGLLCSATLFSQTSIFSDDFESGTGNWTLNGGTGENQWVVNNSYAGLSPILAATPDEPSGVTGSPQSNFLHITNNTICGTLSVCNANFDTGSASNQNATLTAPLVTTGMTTVTVSLYYLCAGDPGTAYGTLQYSIDDGTSWVDAETYIGATTWTQESLTLPDWDDQATLTLRFNWTNGGSGDDPAFSIDGFEITAIAATIETITNVVPDNTSGWCFDTEPSFGLDFESAGTYTSGNVFTAELSDASGSFASPTTIGTLSSTTSGSLTIPCTIPLGTATGNGYRVRVTSSNPAVIGETNNSDLGIEPCLGIEENAKTSSISIFPNPMNDHFTLEGATQISSIKVIDLSGRTMMTFEPVGSNVYSINGLTAGTYFVVISDGKSEVSKRIVKQ